MTQDKNALKIHLLMRGMKQIDLALETGLSIGTISLCVNRNIATPETRRRISQALGVDQWELFGDSTK